MGLASIMTISDGAVVPAKKHHNKRKARKGLEWPGYLQG